MGNRTRRKASTQSTSKSSTQTGDRRPTTSGSNNGGRTPTTKPKGSQFGTSSTDQENHVHVPPELMPDIYGNEFMNTMLA